MGEIVLFGSVPNVRTRGHIGRPGNDGRIAGRFFDDWAVGDPDVLSCLGRRRGGAIGDCYRQNHREQQQSIPEQHVIPPEVESDAQLQLEKTWGMATILARQ